MTALSLAARKGARPVVEMLLGHEGIEVDKVNVRGASPVFRAAQEGHPEVVCVLADKGANLDLAMEDGCTPVFLAAHKGHLELVRILHQYKARLHDAVGSSGTTSLHSAAYNGHLDVVRYLARHGADIVHLDNDGKSPLDLARAKGRTSVISLLEAVESAGSWRRYIALQRMAYILIRHEVSATYKVLPKKKSFRKLRALPHFVFGRNRDTVGAAAPREGAPDTGSEKPETMQVLPDDVFALVCRFLVN